MTAPDGTGCIWPLELSSSDFGWAASVPWAPMADDRADPQNPRLVIDDIHLSQSGSGDGLIVVDTDDGHGNVARYWIDPNATPHWNAHPLAFNISAAAADKSVLGRKARDQVDGVYTLGALGGQVHFVYTPLVQPIRPQGGTEPVAVRPLWHRDDTGQHLVRGLLSPVRATQTDRRARRRRWSAEISGRRRSGHEREAGRVAAPCYL